MITCVEISISGPALLVIGVVLVCFGFSIVGGIMIGLGIAAVFCS